LTNIDRKRLLGYNLADINFRLSSGNYRRDSHNPKEGVLLNTYEIAVLYHPDLEIDLEKASQKFGKIITDNKGKITGEDNWGKRKLAYKIAGHEYAVYVFYMADIPAENVRKIEAALNIADEVIRFLITKIDFKAIEKAEAFKAARNKKAAEREDKKESSKDNASEEINEGKVES
jgi:small subunit ribosomal protein S6